VAEVQLLQNAAWEAIGTATVDGSERKRYWRAWKTHCHLFPQAGNKWASVVTDQLLTFAVAMREGQYGLRAQVKVQSVERALRHVAQRLVLDGHPDPRRASPAQQSLDLPIAHLIKKYRNEDSPAEPKLAIPISTITAIATNYWWNTHLDAAVDLVIITFFYLLRVGEYTTSAKKKSKRTIALQDQDVRLWWKGQVIPHSTGLDLLVTADSATICIAHTKNGTKGAVVYLKAFGGPICLVAALARRIANMQGGPASGSLSSIYHALG
jgi:hypothetical protein